MSLFVPMLTGMADRILNWGGGGAYKRAPETLTSRGSGDIIRGGESPPSLIDQCSISEDWTLTIGTCRHY